MQSQETEHKNDEEFQYRNQAVLVTSMCDDLDQFVDRMRSQDRDPDRNDPGGRMMEKVCHPRLTMTYNASYASNAPQNESPAPKCDPGSANRPTANAVADSTRIVTETIEPMSSGSA